MARRAATTSSEPSHFNSDNDLLLRETNHRWCNDFQLVVGLLALQGKRAANPEVRQALTDAMTRVSILSRARSSMCREQPTSLSASLEQVCDALSTQAELRSILIVLDVAQEVEGLSEQQITTLALVVNELTTNAIKHAFDDDTPGRIRVAIASDSGGDVAITVDDDGRPFAQAAAHSDGLGMELVNRLMASIGGVLISPPEGTKRFELRVRR